MCFLFIHALVGNGVDIRRDTIEVSWNGRSRELTAVENDRTDTFELFVDQERPTQLPDCIATGTIPPGTTFPPTSVVQIRAWLDRCSENHPYCDRSGYRKKNRVVALPPLPNRILDVGGTPAAVVKLVETSDLPDSDRRAEYICLSHRWGVTRPACATDKSTFQHNKAGIENSKFPKTFQDAILLTRELGFKYLWIDSCCIIQDDKNDWRLEGSNMCSIYKNSTLTLAATASESSDGGCFLTVGPQFHHKRINISPGYREALALDSSIQIFTRRKIPHKLVDMPLLRRAWVFQERLLSQRIVHFTANELIWECSAETLCQCFAPTDFPSPKDPRFEPEVKIEHFWAFGENLKSYLIDRDRLSRRWHSMVEEYCTLQLSFQTDKLVAIAGLARDMEKAIKRSSALSFFDEDLYLAGLWKDTFIQDSLWSIPCHNEPQLRSTEWRAPSWSWASVDGPVEYIKQRAGEAFAAATELIHGCSTLVEHDDESGGSSPYIVLRGPLLQAAYFHCSAEVQSASNPGYYLRLNGEIYPFRPDYRYHKAGLTSIDDYGRAFCLQIGKFEGRDEVYYIVLSSGFSAIQEGEFHTKVTLQPRLGLGELPMYERIGFLVVQASDAFAKLIDKDYILKTFVVI